jgi:hypothetical protein
MRLFTGTSEFYLPILEENFVKFLVIPQDVLHNFHVLVRLLNNLTLDVIKG